MPEWDILPLSGEHDRSRFACGQPTLDRYIKDFARQNQDKDVSRTFVLVQSDDRRVYGYYTLSAGQMDRGSLPPKLSKKLPKYPVPVVVLGRLAVDETLKGRKLGRMLLWDALNRSVAASDASTAGIGVFAVYVEAIDAAATKFYQHFGFELMVGSTDKLFLPLSVIRKSRK